MIKQGDAYSIPISITDKDGKSIDPSRFSVIEFSIGVISKYWYANGTGDAVYDVAEKCFFVPLTQSETFALGAGSCYIDARAKLTTGQVIGADERIKVNVTASLSKAVI